MENGDPHDQNNLLHRSFHVIVCLFVLTSYYIEGLMRIPNGIELHFLKYGFCNKYFDRNEPLTS